MAKKKGNNKVSNLEKYTADLEREFQQWDAYYNFGGSDPFHEDGVNLMLIRNHIIYYKRMIEEEINKEGSQLSFEDKKVPDIYYKETPPEVALDYMAIPNRILDTAIEFVRKLDQNPAYQFILNNIDNVFPDNKETEVSKALGISFIPTMQLKNYHELIESGNLVNIRRSFFRKDFDKFIKELEVTAGKIERFLKLSPEEIQHFSQKKRRASNQLQEDEFSDESSFSDEDKSSIDNLISAAQNRKSNIELSNDKNIENKFEIVN